MNRILTARKSIQNNRFIIYPIILVTGVGLLINSMPGLIPDYFNLKNYSKIYELFNLIISSLMSLIGIYITVSLVAYEFFKQKSGIDFHKSFMINPINALFISFSVSTIMFTFISSLLIPDTNPDYCQVSIIYYVAILFSLTILSLFPIAFNLFSSLKPEKLANEELNKISMDTIFIRSFDGDYDKQGEFIENDPLIKIESIVRALITVSDNVKAQVIIIKTSVKMANLIIDCKHKTDRDYVSERLVAFYIKIIDFALLQPNNSSILNNIWSSVEKMYEILAVRKESATHFAKFRDDFYERYFNRLIENNKEEIIFEGITSLKDIMLHQVLENTADDKHIYDLNHYREKVEDDFVYPKDYNEQDMYSTIHWREVTMENIHLFSYLMNKAVKQNKPDMLNKCNQQLNEIINTLNREDIGFYKQSYLEIGISRVISEYAYKAFDKNVYAKGSDADYLLPILFSESLLLEKKFSARSALQDYCMLLIGLQKIDKLDSWFLGGQTIGEFLTLEGDLGEIARRCAYNFDKGVARESLQDIVETFCILKQYYEEYPKGNYHFYNAVKTRLTTILDILEKNKIEDEQFITPLKVSIETFKSKDEFEAVDNK